MEKSKTYFAANLMPEQIIKHCYALQRMRYVLLSVALLLAPALSQAEALADFEAVYRIEKYSSDVGLATYQLQQEAEQTHFSMRTKLIGLAALFRDDRVTEDSWLIKKDNALQLQRYSYQHTGSKDNRNTALTITWSADGTTGTANGSHAGKMVAINVTANVYDALSFQLALMQNAANTGSLDFEVLSKDELKHYSFKRIGQETLEISNQDIDTTIVERQQDNKTTRLWLANKYQFTPVKIEQTEEAKSATHMLIDKLILSGKQVL